MWTGNLNKDFLTRIKTILSAIFLLKIVEASKCYKIYQRFIGEAHTKHDINLPYVKKGNGIPALSPSFETSQRLANL